MTEGENCSSTCPTKDHKTFGECIRAKKIAALWLGGTGPSYKDKKKEER